ncbi:hypothetical protein L1987_46744 [Smallanthus sonchifolius]|uniref:Uncharacterized protein n=1 Tax=Smallanthus sonchifolius TaxID=185202 RepID=A0ACB9G2C7_9ASTR|nr:hypothetical protein L1987_46744 [Smallanthus sonchifolius]
MSVTVTLPKKTNQNPDNTIHVDAGNKNHTSPFYFLIMMPNIIGSFARAYRSNDYSLAVFSLLIFSVFILVDCCLPRYLSMPKSEKSSRKFWLKLAMWFLFKIISFGFVHQFSYFVSLQTTVALCTVALISSVVLLYAFIIVDLVSDWNIRRSGEHQIRCRKIESCLFGFGESVKQVYYEFNLYI